MTTSNGTYWPTPAQYKSAVEQWRTTISDPEIQKGDLYQDEAGAIRLNVGTRKNVCVYRVGEWAIRCFTNKAPVDMKARYQAIKRHIDSHSKALDFLIPFFWIDSGIKVNGNVWPFLKVPYLTPHKTLGEFVSQHRADKTMMGRLANQWRDIIQQMHETHMAHGDLDVTNVLVYGSIPHVKLLLIDFDGMYVPELGTGKHALIDGGHEHFNPSASRVRKFNEEMDRFSALVIYLSLITLSQTRNGDLWSVCMADSSTKLLLGSYDFLNLKESRSFSLLKEEAQKGNFQLQRCLDALKTAIENNTMPPPLSQVLGMSQAKPDRMPLPGQTRILPDSKSTDPQSISNPTPVPVPHLPRPATPEPKKTPTKPTPMPPPFPVPSTHHQPMRSQGQGRRKRSSAQVAGQVIMTLIMLALLIAAIVGILHLLH